MSLLREMSEMFRADSDEPDECDYNYHKALLGARKIQFLCNRFLVAFAAGNSKNQDLLLPELPFFIQRALGQ